MRHPGATRAAAALLALGLAAARLAGAEEAPADTASRPWYFYQGRDYGSESLILQLHGSSEKLDACLELLRPFGISELVRSGKLLMARGRRIT